MISNELPSSLIDTPRLCLRRWIESDYEQFIEMNKDEEVMAYFPRPLTAVETLAMINRINVSFESNGFGLFAVEYKETKQFLGFTGFSVPGFQSFFTPCVEIGWRFKKDSWGRGFATEAAKACLDYGFEKMAFRKIVSFTSVLNQRSERVMQRIGMKYVTEFDHPQIAAGSRLCKHVLYEISKGQEL